MLNNILLSSLCSFLLCSIGIKLFLNYLKNNSLFHQPIRKDGPQSHLLKKNTPTFGGLFIVISTVFSVMFFANISNSYVIMSLFVFIAFSLIGLVDDLMKVLYKNPNGFKGSVKIIIQFVVIAIIYVWLGLVNEIHINNKVFIPINDGYNIYLGSILYVLFVTFVIIGSSNAVNLTDGLDGLVSVPAVINLLCLIFLILIASNSDLSYKFSINYIRNSSDLIIFASSLIGAIVGFLIFNLKPAKIFMGDVGSLAIGSVLGLIATIIKQELVFFIISLLFVIEASSVIIQVSYYKLRKKRVFLMAPLHHHFEKKGLSERKIVFLFWTSSLIFAIIGLLVIF